MKDRIYILFNRNGIRNLAKRTETTKSLPSGTYMAELNLEVDNKFFDNQIPKFDIKLSEKGISFADFINYLKTKKIEFIVKEIKATKNVGYIYLHKKYNNKRVILIIENEQ